MRQLRDDLDSLVDQVIRKHEPLKVTRRGGEAFVIMNAEDWERERETLHVVQNEELTQQISASLESHGRVSFPDRADLRDSLPRSCESSNEAIRAQRDDENY
ncbi:type II toxin-antitoxin system Phd/YefM family antitoxin [Marinobacter salarius]|uniref:type II toxin-antitoxin system Phd/YefM family antitoxin n=1 Tax=Marinobacter salarius TaxID=1420917 RepID=UPI001D0DA31D|nr:type II toxin-antitoxin system Phd/YefM family antitoxin [Marinobacter salarius]